MHRLKQMLTFREDGMLLSDEARDGWADNESTIADDNSLWRQYGVYADLYQFYLDIAWKGSVWYFATVGAILTFVFANIGKTSSSLLILILVFVALVSFGFAALYLRSVSMLRELATFFDYIAGQLHLTGRPHVEFMQFFVLLITIFSTLIGAGSLVLYAIHS